MSRYSDYDDYEGEPEQILAQGRWEHNARVALKGKRGRKALRELREALMALPEHRLIDSAVCTVGGVDARLPALTAEELAAYEARALKEWAISPADARRSTEWHRREREQERERFAAIVSKQGEGVCAIGAYAWHQKVNTGATPAEAFAAVPAIFDSESGDPLEETANLGREAGMTFMLAWELAYRNDEKFRNMTPEERHAAFVAWIDQELAEDAPVPA